MRILENILSKIKDFPTFSRHIWMNIHQDNSNPPTPLKFFWDVPYVSCIPPRIKGKKSSLGKAIAKQKRGTQYTLHSNDGSMNLTLWGDGASCLLADNDFDANATADITGMIYNNKKGEYKGVHSYKANEAVRCYRQVHNNVDVHNQWSSCGHWEFHTRRKQMRVSRTIKLDINVLPYTLCLRSAFPCSIPLSSWTRSSSGATTYWIIGQRKSELGENMESGRRACNW